MLSQNQLKEIKEHLDSSQNPLFFFDNDLDGLCSFLLFRRYLGRGKAVAIKSFPKLDESYTRKIRELNPDKIFILDKALVSDEFLEYVRQHGLEVVWIDHHPPQNPTGEGVYYYNPLNGKKPSNEPTSYLCWNVVKRDEWVALLGCIYDWYLPSFAKDLSKKYPELLGKENNAGDMRYRTEIGKLMMILVFALKDSTTNVLRMIRLLIDAKTPYEIISEDKKFDHILRRHKQINKTYSKLMNKAINQKNEKMIYFRYSGDMSLSRELCNELYYYHPEKLVMVAFVKGEKVNISLSWTKKDLRPIVAKALEKAGGTGGGHPQACGASVRLEDLDKFKEVIESFT